ncbi:SDR family oxidoreductase [Anaerobacillus sp. CMMVII]|uniref:SDR family oxidoreductase n=1 Tax=Anaerobacillus sp. CMMVII TaxID=2755588 RepID=UPI0021B7C3F0|nr:SDR family oxidoreductase [Anaerobacillus sp. CMMVII]MCT8136374.1 SDR family oxidoreductase [Anaerobacillus sp. CMMVII]
MKVLIIGGTKFIGIHIVEELVKRGHDVTIFNRGKTNVDFFPTIKKIVGDREGDLSMLKEDHWDAVIDTCGYVPRVVSHSARALSSHADLYVFVSTISVYQDFSAENITETDDLSVLKDTNTQEVTGETYGPLKVLCEKEVSKIFPNRALIVRPGLIVGPYDPTDRFTYWPKRVALGGEVLAPGLKDAQIQFIDARDLASYIVSAIETKTVGTYNVTGPKEHLTLEDFLHACKKTLNNETDFIWVEDEFLEGNDVGFWTELPLYIPQNKGMSGMLGVNINKALSTGLTFRPLEETIRDTFTWDESRQLAESERKAGLNFEKEKAVLANLKLRGR